MKGKNKIVVTLMAIMMVCSFFLSTDIAFANEDVQMDVVEDVKTTSEADLEISTARELNEFATKVNNGDDY